MSLSALLRWPVTLIVMLTGRIYSLLPARWALGAGNALGACLRLLSFRADVVRQNLEYAWPGTDAQAVETREKVFRGFYRHFGNLILEITMVPGSGSPASPWRPWSPGSPMKRFALRHGEIRGREHWEAAQRLGRGVLFLSNHIGNWEVQAAVGKNVGNIDSLIVTKHLKPEWLHQMIERGRASYGVHAVYEPSTMRGILAQLRRKESVGFVLDQYAGPPVGVRVPLFGIPVGTMTAFAALAKRTGAAVVPVCNYRTEDGRRVVEIEPMIEWESSPDLCSEEELARNTARFVERVERQIRKHPEQWLWNHRRFKGDLSPLRPGEWREGRRASQEQRGARASGELSGPSS